LKDLYQKGVCVFAGPVLDPKGVYGVFVLRAASLEEARALADGDPSVKADLNHTEATEMHIAFPPQTE
jgi:uncharacterized protein YciI